MAYIPLPPPSDPAQMSGYFVSELRRIAEQWQGTVDSVRLKVWNVEPSKYQEGMVVEADGTNWNPGSGAGTYIRRGGAWVKLG